VSGHLCIKGSCDTVGWRGGLAKVASCRSLGLGRAEGVSVAGGGPRARRKSFGVGCPCPRLGSGEARSCPLSGPILDLIAPIRPFQLCADGGYQLRLGVLRVPLIMVPDTFDAFARTPRSDLIIDSLPSASSCPTTDVVVVCLHAVCDSIVVFPLCAHPRSLPRHHPLSQHHVDDL
jgi:hypothetical protein